MVAKHVLVSEIDKFLMNLQQNGRQVSTIRRYRFDLDMFVNWLREEKYGLYAEELTEAVYRSFFHHLMNEKRYERRTYTRIYMVLRKFSMYMISREVKVPLPPDPRKAAGYEPVFRQSELAKEKEYRALVRIAESMEALDELQQEVQPLMMNRHKVLLMLAYRYGLRTQEIENLQMHHLHFVRKQIEVITIRGNRTLEVRSKDMALIHDYLQDIPEPVRPRAYSTDPLMVSFDYQRRTYRWVYEKDAPKRWTGQSMEKMIRRECRRAGLPRMVTPIMMRRTCILKDIHQGTVPTEIKRKYGFKTSISLRKYYQHLDRMDELRASPVYSRAVEKA